MINEFLKRLLNHLGTGLLHFPVSISMINFILLHNFPPEKYRFSFNDDRQRLNRDYHFSKVKGQVSDLENILEKWTELFLTAHTFNAELLLTSPLLIELFFLRLC